MLHLKKKNINYGEVCNNNNTINNSKGNNNINNNIPINELTRNKDNKKIVENTNIKFLFAIPHIK